MRTTATTGDRATLAGLLAHLGGTLLSLAAGVADDRPVEAVVIHDPLDEEIVPPHAVVLAVGVSGSDGIVGLLESLSGLQVSAVVVRAPAEAGPVVQRAVGEAGAVLLELTHGATWTQITSLVRTVIGEGQVSWVGADAGLPDGAPNGDLFAVANAVSALIDAPVTIEDRASRVLAFSGGQDAADASRIETVLGRQVPAAYRDKLERIGVFRRMFREGGPVFVDHRDLGEPSIAKSRTAIAIRAGDEILGSMWAAVDAELTSQRRDAFIDAAHVVALQLLRQRAGADVERRVRSDLVATVLRGGSEAVSAAARLGLGAGATVVLAATPLDEAELGPQADLEVGRQQIADALSLHLSAVHPRSASALIGGIAYGVLPSDSGDRATSTARRIAENFVARTGSRLRVAVGIGRVAHDLRDLERSRADADRALRVLRRPGATISVAGIDEVFAEALLIELSDRAEAEGYRGWGSLAALADYDGNHNAELVPTLWSYLEELGDVTAASERVRVHPNTFRYRLRRIVQIGGLDLADPRVRFAAMLQLRLVGFDGRAPSSAPTLSAGGSAAGRSAAGTSPPIGQPHQVAGVDSAAPTKDRPR
ncbi:PucR family transcriptional regulator [Nakamurella lactea]|uniref:PucR family transcriptional regulator n=1 Tax=Nakamurella lactea TaxID=459515 RepID=UPI0003FD1909|nr:helix-turn-helix domain-containing protein [Nakamurella lactea]